jgi:hypothetical protein
MASEFKLAHLKTFVPKDERIEEYMESTLDILNTFEYILL